MFALSISTNKKVVLSTIWDRACGNYFLSIYFKFFGNFEKKFISPPYQQIFQKHWIKMKVGKQAIFNRRPCKVISISMQMRISSAVGIFLKPKSLNIIIYNTDVFSFFWKHTTNFLNIACKQINCNISFFTPFLMSSPG